VTHGAIAVLQRWKQVLDALVEAPRECQSSAELADALEWSTADVELVLGEMIDETLIQPWDREGERVYTLTPLSAEVLDVELEESGGLVGRLRWVQRGSKDYSERKREEYYHRDPAEEVSQIPDPGPGPAEIAQLADEVAALLRPRRKRKGEWLPLPRVLLTGSESIWKERCGRPRRSGCPSCHGSKLRPGQWCLDCGRGRGDHESCSACGGLPLSPLAYCLRCDRWGLDHRLRRLISTKKLA